MERISANADGRINAEQIAYSKIKEAIRNKQILPGRKLPEAALGEKFGLSRTPIRAALRQLAFEGYVQIIPNRGTFVVAPDAKEINSTYEVRIALEQLAVTLLIEKLTDEKLTALERCIESEQKAFESRNYEEYDAINREYHLMIAEFSENDVLYQYIVDTLNKVDSYILLYDANDPQEVPASVSGHKQLLDLIREKNTEEAREFVAEHIQTAKARLMVDAGRSNPAKDFFSY